MSPVPPTDITPATRVGFAAAHGLLLVVVGWSLLFLARDFSEAAARSLADQPLRTALAAAAVGLPVAAGAGLSVLGGVARLLAGIALLVVGPLVLVADGLGAVGVGWWLLGRTGHDPGTEETAVALAGAAAVAVLGVLPVVGAVLSAVVVALGAGAGARALATRLGHRGPLAAPR